MAAQFNEKGDRSIFFDGHASREAPPKK